MATVEAPWITAACRSVHPLVNQNKIWSLLDMFCACFMFWWTVTICNNLCQSVSICHTNFRIVDCEALSLPSFPTTKTTKDTIKYRKIQQETWAKSKNYEETCSKTALATFSLAFFLGSTNYTFLDFSCSFSRMICQVWEEHERVFSVMAATIPWPSDSLETSNVRSTNDIKLIIHSKMLVNRD